MPKRSLHPGNGASKVDQLNRAVDAVLARTNSKPTKVAADIAPLARIASELRDLPRESFRNRLKTALIQGEEKMSSVAEPITSSRKVPARNAATPRLSFRDAAAAIKFYEKAFGAKESFRFDVGGSIPHAEIVIGDSVIDLTEEWPEGGRFSAETLGSSPVQMSVQVDDVDAAFDRAVAAGMKVLRAPANQFYGHREASLDDPFGYTWNLYTVTEEMSVEEMYHRMGQPHGATVKPAVNPAPRGFFMVTPYIVTPDGDAMIDFATRVFGAEVEMRSTAGGGVHAEVRIGDTRLMMGGGTAEKPFPSR
ncbi:MAG TPA: VOC family protein, partial [Candidatus Binatia bacterium]|nr:VOC family protein [Candidatus Binatia bacterium]